MTATCRLAWTTDVHLNFLSLEKIQAFCRSIAADMPDAVVITGDISEAPLLKSHLLVLEKELAPVPVFFVCGNHDYYNGSITVLREDLRTNYTYPEYEKAPGNLYKGAWWLQSSGVVPLTDKCALIGADGWYDGGYANWFKSRVWMNDYQCIQEFAQCGLRNLIYAELQELSKGSAGIVKANLTQAFLPVDQGGGGFETVYVATHIPPFRENSVYNGKMSDDDWMPHFSSIYMGEALLEVMEAHPDKKCVLLCGHSHGQATHQPLPNLVAHTGHAVYRFPKVNEIFEID